MASKVSNTIIDRVDVSANNRSSTTTGGNASQITDGAACILMMKRSTAEKLGQTILGKYVHSTVAGLAPRIMGAGPTIAVPKLLKQVGISKDDIDVWEINEAFGSVVGSHHFSFPHSF